MKTPPVRVSGQKKTEILNQGKAFLPQGSKENVKILKLTA